MLDKPAYNGELLECPRNWPDHVYTGRQNWDQLIDGKKRVREGGGVGWRITATKAMGSNLQTVKHKAIVHNKSRHSLTDRLIDCSCSGECVNCTQTFGTAST